MRPPVVVGVDLGSSGIRAVAMDRHGRVVRRARARLPPAGPAGQDALQWRAALDAVLADLRDAGRVRAVAVGAQAPCAVAVDGDLSPIAPALTWQHTPDPALEARLIAQSGAHRLAARFLTRATALVPLGPRWILHASELACAWLTGGPVSCWPAPPELLHASGVPPALQPPPQRDPSPIVGPTDPRHGLGHVPVVHAGVDAFLELRAADLRGPGAGCLACGTSASLSVVVPSTLPWSGHRPVDVAGARVVSVPLTLGGRDLLAHGGPHALSAPVPAPPLYLPWRGHPFQGDPSDPERAHAVLEAIAFEAAAQRDRLADQGATLHRLQVLGGVTQWPGFSRLLAATLGVPTVQSGEPDPAAAGAARAGWTALGEAPPPPSSGTSVAPARTPGLRARQRQWTQAWTQVRTRS